MRKRFFSKRCGSRSHCFAGSAAGVAIREWTEFDVCGQHVGYWRRHWDLESVMLRFKSSAWAPHGMKGFQKKTTICSAGGLMTSERSLLPLGWSGDYHGTLLQEHRDVEIAEACQYMLHYHTVYQCCSDEKRGLCPCKCLPVYFKMQKRVNNNVNQIDSWERIRDLGGRQGNCKETNLPS